MRYTFCRLNEKKNDVTAKTFIVISWKVPLISEPNVRPEMLNVKLTTKSNTNGKINDIHFWMIIWETS